MRDTVASLFDEVNNVFAVIKEGDPLESELMVSVLVHTLDASTNVVAEILIPEVIVPAATPEAAALLRILAVLGESDIRRAVGEGLQELVAQGVYPPAWVAQVGRTKAVEAIRRTDAFGESELIAVFCEAAEIRYGYIVQVVQMTTPVVMHAAVLRDVDELRKTMTSDEEQAKWEVISLAEARHRLQPALLNAVESPVWNSDEGAYLPLIAVRVGRLPTADLPEPSSPTYDAAMASAAEFLTAAEANTLADPDAARTVARIIAGFSIGRPGDAPAKAGPVKLAEIFGRYLPQMFGLDTQTRQALPAVARAWVAWTARRADHGDDARLRLEKGLSAALTVFDEFVDTSDAITMRSYVADYAAQTADGGVLREASRRRMLAVPLPYQRTGPDRFKRMDVAVPADRRAILQEEFSECTPPSGMDYQALVEAAVDVAERLWSGDLDITARALVLADADVGGHDILHALIAERL